MKKLILSAIIIASLTSCNIFQHNEYYTRTLSGVITDIYPNSPTSHEVVVNRISKVNVWNYDLDSTYVIGNTKTFKVKYLMGGSK